MAGVHAGVNVKCGMIAIVLAGGNAKRLWPLTFGRPKALLPIAGKPVIDFQIEKLTSLMPRISRIIVSINLKFESQYNDWLAVSQHPNIELVPDDLLKGKERTGAVGAMADLARTTKEEIFIVPGDNIFIDDLEEFLSFFSQNRSPTVALYHAKNLDETRKGSNVVVDEDGKILEFMEKPALPKTTVVGACIYAFPAGITRRFEEYLQQRLPVDEPGRFIEWLHKREPVYGCMLSDYVWDIGTLDSYRSANEFFLLHALQKRVKVS